MHDDPHPLAGKYVRIVSATKQHQGRPFDGEEYHLEDWWDHLTGGSWGEAAGNPACLHYAVRSGYLGPLIPDDDEVVYGHIGNLGHLLHASEIGEILR